MRPAVPAFYFFDVGQGDSELMQFGPVQIMIDGGPPDEKALAGLERAMAPGDRHIDLVILTHPHLDHFGGLIGVMRRYDVGMFLTNGTVGTAPAYKDLPKPGLMIGEGDTITYGDYSVKILGPDETERKDKDPNKTSVVALLDGPDIRILYMGDAHADNEERLRKKYQLKADVLKVGHHGSRFSTDQKFLNEAKPKIAIIEVGKNSYGHPAPATLAKLEAVGAKIYTTRERGMVKIIPTPERLKVFKEK